MSNKRYSNVAELARRTSEDPKLVDQLANRLHRRQLVKKLMAMRAAKELSQEQVAAKMNCSQSRISKFEGSDDDDLRLGDLRDYLRAIGLDLQLVIARKQWPATEQIKFHAFQIKERLAQLVKLAREKPELCQGIQGFHVEALCNLMALVADSAEKLPDVTFASESVVDAEEVESGYEESDCDLEPASV